MTGLLFCIMEGCAHLLQVINEAVEYKRSARKATHIKEENYTQYDADLGWSHIPNARIPDIYGADKSVTINAQGFRANREYPSSKPDDIYRIILLGDSYTFGYGVDDTETLSARIEAKHPGVEVINMGAGAYGIDQIYLWYKRDGARLEADLILWALFFDDFNRASRNRFWSGHYKPKFLVRGDQLKLTNIPVPKKRIAAGDSMVTPSETALHAVKNFAVTDIMTSVLSKVGLLNFQNQSLLEEGLDISHLLFRDLQSLTRERGCQLVFLDLPWYGFYPIDVNPWFIEYYNRLTAIFEKENLEYINLHPAINDLPTQDRQTLFLEDGHYTAAGTRRVIELLLPELIRRVPGFPQLPEHR